MRIGISAQLLGDRPTGVQFYIHGLVSGLLEADTENTYVIYCYENPMTADFACYPNVVVRRIPLPRNKLMRALYEQCVLPAQLKHDRIDVYHAPAYVAPVLLSSVKTVLTIPDVFALTAPSLCKMHNDIYYGWVLPRAARNADRIVALSETAKHDILRALHLNSQKVTTCYPGILEPLVGHTSIPRPFLLHVSNFDPKKNLPFLIRAFEHFKQSTGLPHRLVLAGEKSWGFPHIRRLAQQSPVSSDIVFTGYVSEETKWALYRNASLFVYPSLVEGFGYPPLEAASVGTPVLLSDIPVFRETLPGAAFFNPNSADDCASRIASILAGEPKQSVDLSRFSFRNHAQTCLRIYRELHGHT